MEETRKRLARRYAMPSLSDRSNTAQPRTSLADRSDEPATRTSSIVSDPPSRFSPECVVVCVKATPFADRLIRTGRRVATTLDAELVVLHVDASDVRASSDIDRQRLGEAFQLASELGARPVTVSGRSVTSAIIRYAR